MLLDQVECLVVYMYIKKSYDICMFLLFDQFRFTCIKVTFKHNQQQVAQRIFDLWLDRLFVCLFVIL